MNKIHSGTVIRLATPKRFKTLTVCLLCSTSLTLLANAEEITTEISDPVSSSTINDGSADDVYITDDGSIEVSEVDGFTAVTMDSDNDFYNAGTIDIEDSDNAVGVLLKPGYSGTITNEGSIVVDETYTREDEDDDDDLDGLYAEGEGRYGILLENGGTFTGDIITLTGSTITVEGNDSSAISLQSLLDGNLSLDGTLYTLGDNAVTLDIQQGVTGDILVSGVITAKGENAVAVSIEEAVGGNFMIESSLSSTGFDSTSNTNYVAPSDVDDDTEALEDRLDAEVLLDNTATVAIGASLGEGFLINGDIDDFVSEEDEDDETKDTIEDYDENRSIGTVYSYGSGPAVLISADYGDEQSGDVVIGTVVEDVRDTTDDDDDDDTTEILATFEYEQGVINRGVITAIGRNVGFDATAVRIEGEQDGDAQVIIEGGMLNDGSITARSYEADATGISIGEGAVVESLLNDGAIYVVSYTTDGNTAISVDIEAGAEVSEFENTGSISSNTVGRSGNAIGVRDASSGITSFTNMGTIDVSHTTDGELVDSYGDLIAIDFSAHDADTGVTFVQDYETPTEDTDEDGDIDLNDVTSPYIVGDVLFGAGDDSVSLLAGYISGDIDFGTGDSVFEIVDASMEGDSYFADGNQTLTWDEATYIGDLSFSSSSASITLTNESEFFGLLLTSDSDVSLSITDSLFRLASGNASSLTSLDVSGDANLVFEIDPDDTSSAILSVDGTASIASGVTITPILMSLPDDLTSQTLISAGNLEFDGDYSDLELSNVPWLYTTELELTEGGVDSLDLVFVLKSTDELNLDANEAAAFDSLIEIFASDDDLGAAMSALTTEHDFNEFYDLLIPQRTDASTRYLEVQSNAAFGALDDALETASMANRAGTRVWAQEYFVNLEQDTQESSPGYNGSGFGMALGADRSVGTLNSVGFILGFSSGEFEEKTGGNNPVTTTTVGIGAYVQDDIGPFDLRLASMVSRVKFDAHRDIEFSDTYYYNLDAEWNGWSASASANVSSKLDVGPIYVRPAASFDWFRLDQDSYTETGGDDLLEAAIGEASTDRLTASALLAVGKDWEFSNGFVRTELKGGIRSVLSSKAYEAEVSYLGSDQSFILSSLEPQKDATVFGASILGGGDIAVFDIGYDVEITDTGTTHFAGATVRINF